jgi:hypothetical protein
VAGIHGGGQPYFRQASGIKNAKGIRGTITK